MQRDSETEIDFLDFSYLVEIMKDTINDGKLLPLLLVCKETGGVENLV